jgi:hypothetical protein
MNKNQKMVTWIALVLFWVSCLFAPWELTQGLNHMDTIKYAPVFKAPAGGSWQRRRPSVNVVYSWTMLLASYGMVMLLLSDTSKTRTAEPDQ